MRSLEDPNTIAKPPTAYKSIDDVVLTTETSRNKTISVEITMQEAKKTKEITIRPVKTINNRNNKTKTTIQLNNHIISNREIIRTMSKGKK